MGFREESPQTRAIFLVFISIGRHQTLAEDHRKLLRVIGTLDKGLRVGQHFSHHNGITNDHHGFASHPKEKDRTIGPNTGMYVMYDVKRF